MTEGLRLLPWLQTAHQRDPNPTAHLTDCSKCMDMFPSHIRQTMRCGFEPAVSPALSVYRPPGFDGGPDWDGPSVCPGYTTKLPEVIEASRARLHWKHGALREWAKGDPTDAIIAAIEELEIQATCVERWLMDNPRKK